MSLNSEFIGLEGIKSGRSAVDNSLTIKTLLRYMFRIITKNMKAYKRHTQIQKGPGFGEVFGV